MVEEEAVPEPAGLLEARAGYQQRCPTPRGDLVHAGLARRQPDRRPREPEVVHAVARRHDLAVRVDQDQPLNRTGARVAIRGRDEPGGPVGLGHGVEVEEQEVAAARQRRALVAGAAEADVLLVAHEADALDALGLVRRPVGRVVVHDDRLDAAAGLAHTACEARAEDAAPVVVHDDDGRVERVRALQRCGHGGEDISAASFTQPVGIPQFARSG